VDTSKEMGSSFSVVNNTDKVVWVQQGTQWKVVMGVVGGLGAVATCLAGIFGAIAVGATVAVGAVEGAVAVEAAAGTALGLGVTGWGVTGVLSAVSAKMLTEALNIPHEQAKRMLKVIQKFKEDSVELKPGERFTFYGSLSLVRTVSAMNDRYQLHTRNCWTGPTFGSDYKYTISEHFTNLIQELPQM